MLTIGHFLMLLAGIAAVLTITNTATALREGRARYARGTPQYAHSRLARRHAFYAMGVALLFALLCLTPISSIAIVRIGG
jgi:hypothetical protein